MTIKSLRVLLVGYGKMGREIEECLLSRGHQVVGRVDPFIEGYSVEINDVSSSGADVAIDFSTGASFMKNYLQYMRRNIAVVVGTTGWYHDFDKITGAFREATCPCVYGTNFSIGAQMFFRLVGHATELLSPLSEYDFMITEMHHRYKIDSPSGTAKTAAKKIIATHPRKRQIVSDALQRAIKEDELHVVSVRGGATPGTHTLTVDSLFDTITISHSARNRKGFALGAVLAAEWVEENGGIHNIEDIIEQVIRKET